MFCLVACKFLLSLLIHVIVKLQDSWIKSLEKDSSDSHGDFKK